jgi:uncharacterized lipoprotein YajG
MTNSTRRATGTLMGLIAVLATAGCGASGLDVRYSDAHAALLAAAAPQRLEVSPVGDRRAQTTRVGTDHKKSDIVTSRPVVDIVHEALVVELTKNGYAIGSDGRDALVAANVEEFWLDVVRGYSKTQYVGKVAIAMTVADGRTGDALLTRRYIGIKRREVDQASNDVARDVMDAALARTMHDLATDPDLVAALARSRASASSR